MCCPGCQAVARLIAASGMDTFYQQRTAYSERPTLDPSDDAGRHQVYDDPALASGFTEPSDGDLMRARLLLGGMTCAACTWLVERSLERLPGTAAVRVNLQQGRLDLHYDPEQLRLSEVFVRLEALGYRVAPFQESARREQMQREHRDQLRRLAVAGIGMMQVGMFAVALHAGDICRASPANTRRCCAG